MSDHEERDPEPTGDAPGAEDAGTRSAGAEDAETEDAGAEDAGAEDAGTRSAAAEDSKGPARAFDPLEDHWDTVPENDDGRMGLVDHLDELRTRILTCLGVLFVAVILCWTWSDRILDLLKAAAPEQRFVFLNPAEAFFTHLRVSFYAGLLVSAPLIVYQGWLFLRPALTNRERFVTRALFPFIAFFFALGVTFAYSVILPLGLEFLLGFATNDLVPMLSISAFATFVLTFLMVFGLTFELPVVLFFLNRAGVVDAGMLRTYRPHFVVGCVTVSALLTPPDIVSQVLLAVPVWLLYEGTLLLIGWLPEAGRPRG